MSLSFASRAAVLSALFTFAVLPVAANARAQERDDSAPPDGKPADPQPDADAPPASDSGPPTGTEPGLSEPPAGEADSGINRCLDAHLKGQQLRNQGRLRSARATLEMCTQSGCPEPIQKDCVQWREELQAAIPTVVVGVKGAAPAGAQLSVDGEPALRKLDGRAFALDPGRHRFELVDAEGRRHGQSFVVLQGVKNQPILLKGSDAQPPVAEPSSALPAAFWITGTLGVAGLASFAVLGGVGLSKENRLRDTCFRACAPADVDEVERLYLAADVLGAVGIVGVTAATVIGIVHATSDSGTEARLRIGPAHASLQLTF